MTAAKSLQLRCAAANLESDQKGLWLNCHFLIKSCYQIFLNQILEMYTCAGLIIYTSKEPVCPRVELILKIIIILLIIFLGFIKSKPC